MFSARSTLSPAPDAAPAFNDSRKLLETAANLAARPYARRGIAPSDEPIRVILADDHRLVRQGMKSLLRTAKDIVVLAEAASGDEAVALTVRMHPEIVVMDLEMPVMDGIAATRVLAREAPATRVLIVTMHSEEERLIALLAEGARGYLAKDAAESELVDAIRVVASGEIYVRPSVARMLAAQLARRPEPADTPSTRFATLSDREQEVLRLVAAGYNGPEIGGRLHITAKTVDTYKQRIEDKIGLTHRSEYVRFAFDAGLLNR